MTAVHRGYYKNKKQYRTNLLILLSLNSSQFIISQSIYINLRVTLKKHEWKVLAKHSCFLLLQLNS